MPGNRNLPERNFPPRVHGAARQAGARAFGVPLQEGFSVAPVGADDGAVVRDLLARSDDPNPDVAAAAVDALAAAFPQGDEPWHARLDRHEDLWSIWARNRGIDPFAAPETAVAQHLAAMRFRHALGPIEMRRRAISAAHRRRGGADPTTGPLVARAMEVLRRNVKVRQSDLRPILTEDYLRILRGIPVKTLRDTRDAVIIGLGFEALATTGELHEVDVARDVRFTQAGLLITFRVSGRARTVEMLRRTELDVVSRVRDWIDRAGLIDGPLVRGFDQRGEVSTRALSGYAMRNILKARAAAIGIDPDSVTYKSLRDGFMASAMLADMDEYALMRRAGLITRDTVRRMIARVLPRLRMD